MPYDRNADLPKSVQDNLPSHAQTIYREAFNSAFDEYRSAKDRRGDASREETAHKVAWNAVKQKYHKEGDRWVALAGCCETAPEAGPRGQLHWCGSPQPPMQLSAVSGVQTSRPV